ncbi:hypothetical protein Tco_1290997, partial [Tanacetum coccineum]
KKIEAKLKELMIWYSMCMISMGTQDEMLEDLYKFAMIKESDKEKTKLMVESEKGKAKLMVSDEMVEYVLAKYGKNRNIEDEIADVILEDLRIKYGKFGFNLAKQAEHDLDDVDLVDALDLENKIKKLEKDFSRLLKAKKAKEAKDADEAKLKVNKEVVQVSSDEGFSGDEDVERPTTSKAPIRQFASTSTKSRAPNAYTPTFKASTISRAPIASISNAQAAFTSAPSVYRRIALTGCALGLRAFNDPNAPPPSAP